MGSLVTGATGFIGTRLVKRLHDEGRHIRCLVRSSSNISEIKNYTEDFCYGDILDYDAVVAAVNGADIIYHLAANAHPNNYLPLKAYELNIKGTENILKASVASGTVKKIVVISSIAATGPSTNGELLTEESERLPITNYGVSKLKVEDLCREYQQRHGLPIVIIRPSMVYGIGDKDWVGFFKMIAAAGKDNKKLFIPGDHKNLFDFCYVDNLVNGIYLAEITESTSGDTYFISDGQPYTIAQIITAVCKAYGTKEPVRFVSKRFMMFCARIFDGLGKVFKFDGPVSERTVLWMTTNYWVCNCEKAKRDFGYTQLVSLEDGIKATVEWIKRRGAT